MNVIYNIIDKKNISISEFVSTEKEVIIPEKIDGLNVEEIDFGALDCPNATYIKLPSTLKSIEPNNFDKTVCPILEEIDLSETQITTLNEEIFCDCHMLKKVSFPKNLIELNKTFKDCPKLDEIILPDSVEEVINAFERCNIKKFKFNSNLKNFIKSNSCNIKSVIMGKFKNFHTENLLIFTKDKETLLFAPKIIKDVVLPSETKRVEDNVFSKVVANSIDLNNVEVIGKKAFADSNIKSLKANSLINAGHSAFRNANIDHIELKSLSFINEFLFEQAILGDVILSDACSTICDLAFYQASFTKPFICPKNLTVIGDSAFFSAKLENISFNKKLEEIGGSAFAGCLLNSKITFPESLKVLREHAFTYSEKSQYIFSSLFEYMNGFDFLEHDKSKKEYLNVFMPCYQKQLYTLFSGTNLDNKDLTTFKSLDEYLEKGFSLKDANKFISIEEKIR